MYVAIQSTLSVKIILCNYDYMYSQSSYTLSCVINSLIFIPSHPHYLSLISTDVLNIQMLGHVFQDY